MDAEQDKAHHVLGFPENLHLRIALSFGYPLIPHELTASPKKGGRRRMDEVVHWDHW